MNLDEAQATAQELALMAKAHGEYTKRDVVGNLVGSLLGIATVADPSGRAGQVHANRAMESIIQNCRRHTTICRSC